jgi:hypothetical protein
MSIQHKELNIHDQQLNTKMQSATVQVLKH